MRSRLSILALVFTSWAAQAQTQPAPQDLILIQAFSQANVVSKEVAGNCASIAVIKLAIGRYGADQVLEQVDTLATEYAVVLRDHKHLTLTKQEFISIDGLDRFVPQANPAIYKTARFLYAVMAKNKLLLHPEYSTVKAAAYDGGNYQLIPEAEANFTLLGLENSYQALPTQAAYTQSGVVVASERHVAYGGNGYYDEYGTAVSDQYFRSNHCKLITCSYPNRRIRYVYCLK